MTIKEAIKICENANLLDWELVEYAQCLVHNNMAYSYDNSFDLPFNAFKKGKGYCWQQARSLQKILCLLGFNCWLVYAVKTRIPESIFKGIRIKAHTSGHVWCRVNINDIEKDVCPGNIKNKPDKVHFTPLSKILKYNWFISIGCYFGSAYINYKRWIVIKKIMQTKVNYLEL
jgi:hypothetical protein